MKVRLAYSGLIRKINHNTDLNTKNGHVSFIQKFIKRHFIRN